VRVFAALLPGLASLRQVLPLSMRGYASREISCCSPLVPCLVHLSNGWPAGLVADSVMPSAVEAFRAAIYGRRDGPDLPALAQARPRFSGRAVLRHGRALRGRLRTTNQPRFANFPRPAILALKRRDTSAAVMRTT